MVTHGPVCPAPTFWDVPSRLDLTWHLVRVLAASWCPWPQPIVLGWALGPVPAQRAWSRDQEGARHPWSVPTEPGCQRPCLPGGSQEPQMPTFQRGHAVQR